MRWLPFAPLVCAVACAGDPDPTAAHGAAATCRHPRAPQFPSGAPWTQRVDQAPVDPSSGVVIEHLEKWHASSGRFRIDFSFHVLGADETTELASFTPTDAFFEPDCDPAPVPLPRGGALEGETGYGCLGDGDCHLLVFDRGACRLHEMWRADVGASGFRGGCQAIWDLTRVYPEHGRGEWCTSADAAGLPITPLLFDADEVASGSIDHALRFTLPNTLIREGLYVHPATHSTAAAQGSERAPPYGARMRLKASFDLARLSPPAQVVARALQRYGMFLADGGKVTFTAASDHFTETRWSDVGLEEHALLSLSWTDFELVRLGAPVRIADGDCVREPLLE